MIFKFTVRNLPNCVHSSIVDASGGVGLGCNETRLRTTLPPAHLKATRLALNLTP